MISLSTRLADICRDYVLDGRRPHEAIADRLRADGEVRAELDRQIAINEAAARHVASCDERLMQFDPEWMPWDGWAKLPTVPEDESEFRRLCQTFEWFASLRQICDAEDDAEITLEIAKARDVLRKATPMYEKEARELYDMKIDRDRLAARVRELEEVFDKLPKYKDTGEPFIPGVDVVYVAGTDGKVYMTNEADHDDEGWYVMYTEEGMPTLMTTRDFYSTREAAASAAKEADYAG